MLIIYLAFVSRSQFDLMGGVAEQEQEQLTGVEILWKFFDCGLKMAGCPIFRLSQLHNLLTQ